MQTAIASQDRGLKPQDDKPVILSEAKNLVARQETLWLMPQGEVGAGRLKVDMSQLF